MGSYEERARFYPVNTQQSLNPWLLRLPILLIIGGILFVAALGAFVMAIQMRYDGKIIPGVSVYGVNLGGMTRDEAIAAVSNHFTYDQQTVFTFRDGERVWPLSAGDLGVSFDIEATVDQAFASGSSSDVVSNLVDQALTWLNGESIAPIIRFDQNAAMQQLAAIAGQVDRQAYDASVALDGVNVVVSPSQVGRVLDIPAMLDQLDSYILNLTGGGEIPLVVRETLPTIWNADETANQLRAALSSPLQLVAEGPNGTTLGPWTASVDQIAALLRLELVDNGDGTRSYQAHVDISAFEDFLNQLAPGLITPPQNARFHFDPATQQLVVIQPAVSGRELNIEQTLARLEEAVFRYDSRIVPMAFNYTLPRYHDGVMAAELGITQMVSSATTYFAGSTPERIHNITEGASRFDGIIIGPGEEFSFNYFLGDMSEEAGFVEAKVIEGERTVDGIGGGICQVSTTIFRSAFFGGFRIIERNSHAYRVGYYEQAGNPPGLDAAIWTPERDMRFQNDTPYSLLIEASIFPATNAIEFRFYSTNPGRVVTIETPIIRNTLPALPTLYEANDELQPGQALQVDWAAEGADVTVYRTITDMQGIEISRDSIYTHYLPWAAIYQVPPGDMRLAG